MMLVMEYISQYAIETVMKGMIYSVKLKLEFAVLNQLMRLANSSRNAAIFSDEDKARNFAVVTSPNCRAPLARLLATRLPDIPVLSFSELPEHRRVDVLHVVGGGGPALAAPQSASGEFA